MQSETVTVYWLIRVNRVLLCYAFLFLFCVCCWLQVEVNQQNWLQENDLLSRELEGALQENEMLRAEVGRLQASLELRERQLFEATGVPPESEEF